MALLVAVTGVAVWAVTAQAEGCGRSGAVRLTVAAAPEIAPAVQDAATAWGKTNPVVNGDCIRVDVRAVPSADMAQTLAVHSGGALDVAAKPAATPSDDDVPAVWIPDSIAWVNRAVEVNRDLFDTDTPSVASSPVVMGMPEQAASAMTQATGGKLRVQDLAQGLMETLRTHEGKIKLAMADPRRDSASLAGAIVLNGLLVAKPADLPNLVGAYRMVGSGRIPDTTALSALFTAQSPINVAPMSEQAVLDYDTRHPDRPLAAVPLDRAVLGLDYPYAAVAGKPRGVSRAADLFRLALTGTTYQSSFAKRGFRAPDGTAVQGFPAGHGAPLDRVAAPAITDQNLVDRVLNIWGGANTASRLLALADLTSSMNTVMETSAGQAVPRIDVLRGTAREGLKLFTDDSQVGMWGYAANLGPDRDYLPAVDVATLAPGQRNKLNAAIDALHTVPTDSCGLYESVLAAYKSMKSGYVPNMSNTIAVFTDGGSNKPGGLKLDDALTELEKLVDVTKPIRIIALGIGPKADKAQLDALAKATGGKAFMVNDASQINLIFLQALLRVNE